MKYLNNLRMKFFGGFTLGLSLVFVALNAPAQTTNKFSFQNLNLAIPDGSGSGLSSTTNLTSTVGSLSAARVRLTMAGEFNGDLYAYLRHVTPGGTNIVVLLNRPGRSATNSHGYDGAGLDVTLDDSAVNDIHLYGNITNLPAGSPLVGRWQPDGRKISPTVVLDTSARNTSLNSFSSMTASGDWTLFVADVEPGGTNMLTGWELEIVGTGVSPVTWPTPADIFYGTALGATQLNASSSVPGTFAYNPPTGTVLSAGSNQTLSVIFTPTDLASYASVTNTVNINVQKKTLTIAANNTNKVYGQTIALAGTGFTSSGLANADTVTSVTLTSAGTAATATVAGGPYAIVPSAAVGSGLANYSISYANGTLTVSNKTLTIAANNTNKVYGQTLALAGTGFTSSGLANADTVTSVTLTSAGTAATATVAGGPYAIVPSAAVGSGLANYSISYANGTLTVSNKTLTIAANNTNKVYGQTLALAGTGFTSSGLANADTVTSVTLTSAGTAATATVAGGPYAIVPSAAVGSGLANYSISYANGTLTVSNKTLTIAANNTNKVYGQTLALAGTGFTSSGLANADTVTSVTLTSAGTAATATVAGGPYAIVPSAAVGSGLANYSISYANGTLAITPAGTVGIVSASRNPARPGESLTLSFAMSAVAPGSGNPSGTVQFRLDGGSLGSASLTAGVASFDTAAIGFGAHAVVAEYSGDGNFNGATNALGTNLVINTPPIAVADSVTRSLTNELKIRISNLLGNDVESDATDAIRLVSVGTSSVLGGTIVSNGLWLYYTPPVGNTNADSFTYSIADTLGGSSTGTVNITTRLDAAPSLTLRVTPLAGGNYLIQFDGFPNGTYDVEAATALNPANWQTWVTTNTDANGMITLIDTSSNGAPAKYYRTLYRY